MPIAAPARRLDTPRQSNHVHRFDQSVHACGAGAGCGQWKGLPVFVARSGNFTVEHILARCRVGETHSNDVSIYSCALGWHLAGNPVQYKVAEAAGEYAWLGDYLQPGVPTSPRHLEEAHRASAVD